MMWFFDKMLFRSVCYKSKGSAEPKITSEMRASAEIAAKQWNKYQQDYVPFENKFIAASASKVWDQKSKSYVKGQGADNAAAKADALSGMVNADVQQQAAKIAPGDPNAGGALGKEAAVSLARTNGAVDANQSAVDAQARQLGNVVALGRGQQGEALTGLTQQASNSSQIANARMLNDVETEANTRTALLNTAGSGVGAISYGVGKATQKPAVPEATQQQGYGVFQSPALKPYGSQ